MTDSEWNELWDLIVETFNHNPGGRNKQRYREYIEQRLSYREAQAAIEKVIEARINTVPPPASIIEAHQHTEGMRRWRGDAALSELLDDYEYGDGMS